MKKTVVFDFDGVIHSYTSGWKGEDVIPDPPVEGIADNIQKIREAGYAVAVVSTRCASPKGMEAVNKYLADNEIAVDKVCKEKPPAIVYIDDRAICFDGRSDELLEKINNFKPWYQKNNQAATNYDNIKSMSVEQMSFFLMKWSTDLLTGKAPINIKKWLESEEQDDG